MGGLSPWVRGTHFNCLHTAMLNRFIPVGTGNATTAMAERGMWTVYPREYGERLEISRSPRLTAGLSPWVRGTPYHHNHAS